MSGNKLIERIKREKIALIEVDEPADYFAHKSDEGIFVSKQADLDTAESQFSLAHELGHAYQDKSASHFERIATTYCRTHIKDFPLLHSLVFSLCLLWNEWDAWLRGQAILEEEQVSTDGYISFAKKCFSTYLKNEAWKLLFYVASLYPLLTVIVYFRFEPSDKVTLLVNSFLCFLGLRFFWELYVVLIAFITSMELKKEETRQ